MLSRKPIYPDYNYNCNQTNCHEWAPYIINNKQHIIDQHW